VKPSFLRCLRSVSLSLYHSYYEVRESALISSNKTAKSESTCAEVAWCYMTHRVPGCPCHRYNSINIYKDQGNCINFARHVSKFTFLSWDQIDLASLISLNHQNGKPTNTGEFPAGLLKLWHQYLWHYSTSRVSWSYALLGPSAARNWGLAGWLHFNNWGCTTIECWCTTEREGNWTEGEFGNSTTCLGFCGPFLKENDFEWSWLDHIRSHCWIVK